MSPFFALVISFSASGRRRLALASVVVIRPFWNSAVARFARISRSWDGLPPRRAPLVGLGISCSSWITRSGRVRYRGRADRRTGRDLSSPPHAALDGRHETVVPLLGD